MPDSSDAVGVNASVPVGASVGAAPAGAVVDRAPADSARVTKLALAGVFAAVLAVSAWVSIPFHPVPLTLQTLTVLVAGGLLGRIWGTVSVGVYVLVGVAGVPVFSNGSAGVGVLLGPTGGYLVGFIVAAFVVGAAADAARSRGWRGRRVTVALGVGVLAASAVIYAVGVPWLMVVTGMTPAAALAAGMAPFLVGDALKAIVAVILVRAVGAALEAQGLR